MVTYIHTVFSTRSAQPTARLTFLNAASSPVSSGAAGSRVSLMAEVCNLGNAASQSDVVVACRLVVTVNYMGSTYTCMDTTSDLSTATGCVNKVCDDQLAKGFPTLHPCYQCVNVHSSVHDLAPLIDGVLVVAMVHP